VTFNGIAHTATYVSSSQLTIALTTADLAMVGIYPVVVTNPAPGGGASSALSFTVTSSSSASEEWAWEGGSNTGGVAGVYGSLGVPSVSNVPGERVGATSWTDGNGNLWLFGGYGVNQADIGGYLNDLWEYSPTAKTWTWVAGANTPNQAGIYGTQGIPATSNTPGARESAVGWMDGNGNLWLFGGGTSGHFNDLWEFNPTAKTWTWVAGANTSNQSGVYGTQGTPATTNVPGARGSAASWIDGNGNLWCFGGYGVDSTGNSGYLNDLWEFSPTAKTWTWVAGANTSNQAGVYGTQGTPATMNAPGARYQAASWIDSNGNLWLFGGYALDSKGNDDFFSDLWEFNPTAKTWTWVTGANTPNQTGVYGTQGTPASTNVPGARYSAVTWTDGNGNFWLFGGGAGSSQKSVFLNDLWEFNPTPKTWTWVNGPDMANQPGAYGTQGIPAVTNIPGARDFAVGWIDGSGNLWLFGGDGVDSTGLTWDLNDLWRFQSAIAPPAITSVSVTCSPASILTTQTSACTPTVAGTEGHSTSVTWSVSPTSVGSVSNAGVFTPSAAGTATITATSTQDSTKSGGATVNVATPTALVVTITDLPTGTLASVTVTDPNGHQTILTSSQTISAIPGTYTLVAEPVAVGASTYNATQISQAVTVIAGATSSAAVDYYDIVPNTTKVLDQAGQESLTVSSDGSTVTFSSTSEVAQSLQAGNVLASAPTSSAPNGLLVNILSVSNNGSTIVANVSQATLDEAIQRGSLVYTQTFSPSSGQSVVTLLPGSKILTVEQAKKEGLNLNSASLPNSCSTDSNTFVEPYSYTVNPQGISVGVGGVGASGQVQLSGTLQFCPQLLINVKWGFLSLQSATVVASFGEHATMTILGQLSASVDAEQDVATITQPAPTVIFIGDVPVVLQARATVYVGSSLEADASFYASAEQDAQAQAGLQYANGATTPIQSATNATANNGVSLDGELNGKVYVGLKVGALVYGTLFPNIATDAYVGGSSGPPEIVSWGLESNVGLDASIIGTDITVGLSSPELNLFSIPIWQESVSFAPTLQSVTPNAVDEGTSDVTIALAGSNFVPDSVVNFNGIPLSATFSDPGSMTAVILASDLLVPGSYPITVTSPDTVGAVSNAVAFTVSGSTLNPVPSITSLLPNSLVAGATPQTLTIIGTGFLPSSSVTFNGVAHTPAYVSASQLTISLTSADLVTAGSYPVVVTNPAPGGGSSVAIDFTVSPTNPVPAITSLSPASLAVGATPQALTINGTGFLNTSAVTFDGVTHDPTFVSASQLTISLTSADLAAAGTYQVVVTNPAPGGGASPASNFTVMNPQTANEWTWMSGSNLVNGAPVYGTLGVASSANVPGARGSATSWTDHSGNLWLFGGFGIDYSGDYSGNLNDLWTFTPSNNAWTWVSGSNNANVGGVYGTKGLASTSNVPGSRSGASSWIDGSGNLWLFGGGINDLWEFNPANKTWTWVSGADTGSQPGAYGTMGVPSTANVPGARSNAVSWIDGGGNLWLFGGQGSDSTGNGGYLNDLWEFNPANVTWTWVSGSNTLVLFGDGLRGEPGVYGTQGISSAANVPCGRLEANSWIDSSGNLWLFGGYGQASATSGAGVLNDLWEFNPTNKQWTWVGGTDTPGQAGVYGTLGVAATANTPGARELAMSSTDASGNLWLFGGIGYDSVGYYQYLNDLWEFNPSNKTWTWISGSNRTGAIGVWGTLGIAAPTNVPGARDQGVSWIDNGGYLWLFGGYGSDSVDNGGNLNDLWRYQPPSITPPTINPTPAINGLIPSFLQVGSSPQTLEINGTGLLPSSAVTFNGVAHTSTYASSNQLTIGLTTADLLAIGNFPVVVTNPAPGGGTATSVFTVSSTANGMIISPSAVTVPAGATQTFIASPPGGGTVTWSVREGSSAGEVSASGIYSAPSTTGTYHVVATSSTDSALSATATVTVVTAPSYSVLYSFPYSLESAALTQGTDGNLYGTNEMIAYKITSSGTFTQLAQLSSSPSAPISSLIQASDGDFYGVNSQGDGSIFKMDSSGNVTSLYAFPGLTYVGSNGLWPWAGLIQGKDGYFYGTTYSGGSTTCVPDGYGVPAYGPYGYSLPPWISGSGCGTVFKIDSLGNVIVLYSFSGQNDGNFPQAPLAQGSDSELYGTTSAGGAYGYGTVFKLSTSGSLQVLHSFSSADGNGPVAALTLADDGNLYGTTSSNMTGGGEVFELDPSGNNFTVLHVFSGQDGWSPVAPLIQGSDGNFYGTTWAGGDLSCGSYYLNVGSNYPYVRAAGCGAVFKMDSSGDVTVLHNFEEPQFGDGDSPYAGVIFGNDGYLYGTTYSGGTSIYAGTVFRLGVPAAP
jgi:uncharacterized repeat protein (TIGR03803 family)